MVTRFLNRTAGTLVGLLLIVAVGLEVLKFAQLAEAYLNVPPSSDSTLFLAMGRAWLNGLHLYRDLFETKPPGVYLAAALALRMSSGFTLLVWFQLVLLAMLPVALAWYSAKAVGRESSFHRWLVIASTVVLGLAVADETLFRSGGYLAEGFGLLFATIPALAIAGQPTTRPWGREAIAGVSLGIAAMFMEPFGLSGLLGMAVFCRCRADCWRVTQILGIAGLTVFVILMLSGTVGDYVSLYLPEMLGGRSTSAIMYPHYGLRFYYVIDAPLWVRSLNVAKLFSTLPSPVTSSLLGVFGGVCIGFWPVLRTRRYGTLGLIVSGAVLSASVMTARAWFVLYEVVAAVQQVGKAVPWGHPLVLKTIATAMGVPTAIVVALAVFWRRSDAVRQVYPQAVLMVAALILMTMLLAMGGGDYRAPYLIFTFPPLMAVAVFTVTSLAQQRRYGWLALLTLILVANAVVPRNLQEDLREITRVDPINHTLIRAAPAVDAILSNCHESRYIMAAFELRSLAAATRHSPYQIDYGVIRAFGGFDRAAASDAPNPFLAEKFRHDLDEATIIVAFADDDLAATPRPVTSPINPGDATSAVVPMDARPNASSTSRILAPIAEVLRKDFTTDPPPCAQSNLPIAGLQVYFRRR